MASGERLPREICSHHFSPFLHSFHGSLPPEYPKKDFHLKVENPHNSDIMYFAGAVLQGTHLLSHPPRCCRTRVGWLRVNDHLRKIGVSLECKEPICQEILDVYGISRRAFKSFDSKCATKSGDIWAEHLRENEIGNPERRKNWISIVGYLEHYASDMDIEGRSSSKRRCKHAYELATSFISV